MAELIELIDLFDRLVAAAVGTAPASAVEEAAVVARRARSRRGYLGETVVVALAGGTGSGKSSLVNALAGETVAAAGAQRPTTSQPLAWIPANPEPGLTRLLDDLGIEDRVGHELYPWLAVIDLPDTDSVVIDHRATVERLLPEVDAVVWVVDPEKYQDRILHRDHLRPLSAHGDRFRFVMNQIDRVDETEVGPLLSDLEATLNADGYDRAMILAVAADPEVGPAIGIERLIDGLAALGDAKTVVHAKLRLDLDEAARRLATAGGVESGGGIGFNTRWEATLAAASAKLAGDVVSRDLSTRAGRAGAAGFRSAAGLLPGRTPVRAIAPGTGRQGETSAVVELDRLLDEVAAEVEGLATSEVRRIGSLIDSEVRAAAETVRYGEAFSAPESPDWLAGLAWIRRLLAVGVVIGLVWLYDRVNSGQTVVAPAAVILGLVVALIVSRVVAARAGRRAGIAAIAERRVAIERGLRRELDRRIGNPLRQALRQRAGMAAALAEFQLAGADQTWGTTTLKASGTRWAEIESRGPKTSPSA